MTASLYVLGAPGVGKSTLCAGLLQNASPATQGVKLHGLLFGHQLAGGGVYLGRVREHFPGTDGLPMNVGPDAVAWLEQDLPDLIVGEGARLGYAKFLNALALKTDLTVLHLTATKHDLDSRCNARGSTQTEAWRKGAESRAANSVKGLRGVRVIELSTSGLTSEQVLRITKALLPDSLHRLK